MSDLSEDRLEDPHSRAAGSESAPPAQSALLPDKLFPSVSRLGLGCASLGSRVEARKGLRALERAFDRGVNWFDMAPSYGDGEAESIFGTFASSRRDRIHICTKVGLVPSKVGSFARRLKPLAQRLVTLVPRLRYVAARARPAPRRLALEGQLITSSLDASLRRLRTDYVDVLALHYPDLEALARDDVLRALEHATASGKARAVGVAGGPHIARVVIEQRLPIEHIQFPPGPFGDNLAEMAPLVRFARSVAVHSIFANLAEMQSVKASTLRSVLIRHGYSSDVGAGLRAALLDHALSSNQDGPVVISAFEASHQDLAFERVVSCDGSKASAVLRSVRDLISSNKA